jgi:hypothetical protein
MLSVIPTITNDRFARWVAPESKDEGRSFLHFVRASVLHEDEGAVNSCWPYFDINMKRWQLK